MMMTKTGWKRNMETSSSTFSTLWDDIGWAEDSGELRVLKKTIQTTYDDGNLSREEYNKLVSQVGFKLSRM